jgi:hypothetical protein
MISLGVLTHTRQAAIVAIWLGQAENDSDLAMDVLINIQSRKPWSTNQHQAVLTLWDKPYWRRVWIVQEVLLAVDIVILCGQQICHWNHFQGALGRAHDCRSMPFRVLRPVRLTAAGRLIKNKIDWAKRESGRSLGSLIEQYSGMDATDAKDRVYGLLGLVEGPSIPADYTLTREQLYNRILDTELRGDGGRLNSPQRYMTVVRKMLRLPSLDVWPKVEAANVVREGRPISGNQQG